MRVLVLLYVSRLLLCNTDRDSVFIYPLAQLSLLCLELAELGATRLLEKCQTLPTMQNVTGHARGLLFWKTKAERDMQEMCNLYMTVL